MNVFRTEVSRAWRLIIGTDPERGVVYRRVDQNRGHFDARGSQQQDSDELLVYLMRRLCVNEIDANTAR